MNNEVKDRENRVVGFRCNQCSEVKDKMWGETCNGCRKQNEISNALLAAIRGKL